MKDPTVQYAIRNDTTNEVPISTGLWAYDEYETCNIAFYRIVIEALMMWDVDDIWLLLLGDFNVHLIFNVHLDPFLSLPPNNTTTDITT